MPKKSGGLGALRRLLAGLAVVAAGLATAAAGVPATANAADGPEEPPHAPGQLVSAERLPQELWLPGSSAAYRITYTSRNFDGHPTIVAGAVFVPSGIKTKLGWPVVSWAHGTVGVADTCAQVVAGRSQRDIDYLSAWLRAGFAVVATEYEGLGMPGPHPYLNGLSEAFGVIDIVRAAQQVDKSISRTWLAVGQSQGGQAALFTGAYQQRYAPELDFRGSIATAPPTQWRTTIGVAKPFDPATPANPFALLLLEGMRATHQGFDPAAHLTPMGQALFAKTQDAMCFKELAEQLAGHSSGEVYDVNAGEQERLTQLLEQDSEIPIVEHSKPVYIAQGTADTVVYPPASQTTANQLEAAGSDVTFKFYPGADHSGVLAAARDDLLAWAADRVADRQ